jgi:predicted DNA-binding transcriptional regulator YafY
VGVYRVSRVRRAQLLDEHFVRPDSFDLATFWQDWCAEFETSRPVFDFQLRFAPDLIPKLCQIFGEGVRQRVEEAPPADNDGWLTLDFTLETLEMARNAVLSFGPMGEVVAPVRLRDSVIEHATGLLTLYARTPTLSVDPVPEPVQDGD